jgi:ribosome maturation factor RimP
MRAGEDEWAQAHFFFAEKSVGNAAKNSVWQATMALDLDQIRRTAARVAASHGLDVVEVEFHGGAKHRLLRVFIEKNAQERARLAASVAQQPEMKLPEHASLDQLAGVTHEDCERFSQDFGTVIDVEELIPGTSEYTLEVSSPGLDRKLRGAEDFERFRGSLAKVQTFTPVAGNRHWLGRITAVSATEIVLELGEAKSRKGKKMAGAAETKTVTLSLGNLEKANLEPEL